VPKKARGVLHLVNDNGRRMALKETFWLLFGLFGFGGEIERHKRVTREEVEEGGGLACLSGSGQNDRWPRLCGAFQPGLNIA